MKVETTLAMLLMAGMAAAQVAPTTPGKVADQLRPATPGAERPAAPPSQAVPAAAPGRAAGSPFAATKQKAAATNQKAAPAKGTAATAAKAKPAPAPASSAKGRRDPFLSPIVAATGGPGQAPCTTGKRCLVADEILLRGVVKSQGGMIAVVENAQHRTYFLHENDPIFSGSVVKITGDSVVIRENTTDSFGKPASRDVVKRVAPTA